MFDVQNITSDGKQKQRLVLQDGTQVDIEMEYLPLQSGWVFNLIRYQDFEIRGLKICVSPNLLYQYKNVIPFGIAVTSRTGFEPTQQQDFSSNEVKMYILTQEELQIYEDYLSNG